jgi:hypothetical protein
MLAHSLASLWAGAPAGTLWPTLYCSSRRGAWVAAVHRGPARQLQQQGRHPPCIMHGLHLGSSSSKGQAARRLELGRWVDGALSSQQIITPETVC